MSEKSDGKSSTGSGRRVKALLGIIVILVVCLLAVAGAKPMVVHDETTTVERITVTQELDQMLPGAGAIRNMTLKGAACVSDYAYMQSKGMTVQPGIPDEGGFGYWARVKTTPDGLIASALSANMTVIFYWDGGGTIAPYPARFYILVGPTETRAYC